MLFVQLRGGRGRRRRSRPEQRVDRRDVAVPRGIEEPLGGRFLALGHIILRRRASRVQPAQGRVGPAQGLDAPKASNRWSYATTALAGALTAAE